MKKTIFALSLCAACASAAPVQWSGNGHWYDVSAVATTWSAALTAASGQTFMGMQGYLATITSAEENAFVHSLLANVGSAWAAGTDSETEGVWKWAAGPESGASFWNNGTTVTYAAWNPGEPNNVGNEDFLILNQFGAAQTWNDGPTIYFIPYVTEYSPSTVVPEPSSLALMAAAVTAIAALRRRK